MTIKEELIRTFRLLKAPFVILYHGHLTYIGYLAITIGLTTVGIFWGDYYLREWLFQLFIEVGLSPSQLNIPMTVIKLMAWALLIPMLVTVICLPLRNIYLTRELSIKLLAVSTLPAFFNVAKSVLLSIKVSAKILLPAVVMVVGYFTWAIYTDNQAIYQMYTICMVSVCATTIFHTSPVILAPFISVCGHFNPRDSLRLSVQFFGRSKFKTFTVILIIFGVSVGVLYSTTFVGKLRLQLLILLGYLWYLSTLSAVYCIRRLAEHGNNGNNQAS